MNVNSSVNQGNLLSYPDKFSGFENEGCYFYIVINLMNRKNESISFSNYPQDMSENTAINLIQQKDVLLSKCKTNIDDLLLQLEEEKLSNQAKIHPYRR